MTTPVKEPSHVDVLCGRGGKQRLVVQCWILADKPEFAGKTNHHPGNILFRERIGDHHQEYMQHDRQGKTAMTRELLVQFRSEGVRFLREDPDSGYYVDVGDQHARTKISQALRDNTTNPSKENKGRGKRVIGLQGTTNIAKYVKVSEEPRGTSSSIALLRSNTPREVSPVPSAGDRSVPSVYLEEKKQLYRLNTRQRNSIILPPDASLFEIVEGSDAGLDLESPKVKAVAETIGPLMLPELPSMEAPLALPSMSRNDAPDAESLSLNLELSLGCVSDNILVEAPREVSPLPRSGGDHGFVYQPFESESDDVDFGELPGVCYAATELGYDSHASFLDDTPFSSLLEEHDRTNDQKPSIILHRFIDGFSSISQLSNDDDFNGRKASAFKYSNKD